VLRRSAVVGGGQSLLLYEPSNRFCADPSLICGLRLSQQAAFWPPDFGRHRRRNGPPD